MSTFVEFSSYTMKQRQELTAYYITKLSFDNANHLTSINPFQDRLEMCITDLAMLDVSIEEADRWIDTRRWWAKSILVDLDEPGAPSEAQCRTYHALYVASERMGHNNYATWIASVKKYGKRFGGYCVSDEQQSVTNAMGKVLAGKMTPEQAMALLNEYDVMHQRLGK